MNHSEKSKQPWSGIQIKNLQVEVESKLVLKGVSLEIKPGEIHALMGRNGTGKTSLSYALMGHPKYKIVEGDIRWNGESILGLSPEERARLGIFLLFQSPVSIPGVPFNQFIRASVRAVKGDELSAKALRKQIEEELKNLEIPEQMMSRSVHEGFSGGERKRMEVLQMRLLKPLFSILDEPDSGLDVDALRLVAREIERFRSDERSFLIVTHYQRLLNHVKPDHVHVFSHGRIVKSGDASLAKWVEEKGYESFEGPQA
jgi:Fe-S cluster assembly ATP-binding protein